METNFYLFNAGQHVCKLYSQGIGDLFVLLSNHEMSILALGRAQGRKHSLLEETLGVASQTSNLHSHKTPFLQPPLLLFFRRRTSLNSSLIRKTGTLKGSITNKEIRFREPQSDRHDSSLCISVIKICMCLSVWLSCLCLLHSFLDLFVKCSWPTVQFCIC